MHYPTSTMRLKKARNSVYCITTLDKFRPLKAFIKATQHQCRKMDVNTVLHTSICNYAYAML